MYRDELGQESCVRVGHEERSGGKLEQTEQVRRVLRMA